MHVGLVVERFVGRNGGEQGTAELAEALSRQGVRVTVLSAGAAQPSPADNFEAVDLGLGSRLNRRGRLEALDAAVQAQRVARSIDLVHSMNPMIGCDIFQPRGGTVAETFNRYLQIPRSRWQRWRLRWKLCLGGSIRAKLAQEQAYFARRPLPMIVAMSGYVADQLSRYYAVPESSVRRVFGAMKWNPVGPEQRTQWRTRVRQELAVPDATTLLLFVAQHYHQKGLGYLLEAMRRVESLRPATPLALAVIGRDKAEPYRVQARRLGLEASVHFLGRLDRQNVWAYYAAADAMVLPTVFDACSRTVLESLAMGTPVVTTAHNGAGELLGPHHAGLVISNAWAIDELAEAIGQMAEPVRRAGFSAGAATAGPVVRIERMASELAPLYQECLSTRGAVVSEPTR